MAKEITDREKAAIIFNIYTGCDDWPRLYAIASDKPASEVLKDKYLSDRASKWKRSADVQRYLQEQRDRKAVADNAKRMEIEKMAAENERKKIERETGRPNFVDYTDPANQRRKLNELINDASDPGEALDALKVVISGQRDDRQAAREGRQVRAYLPLLCHNCPLYQKAQTKLNKK